MPLRPTPQIARIYLLVAALLLAMPGLCSLYSRYEGKVLVALPMADADPYFARTLVYVGQHDGWGTIGLILNRPLSDEHFAMLKKDAPPGFDWRFGGPLDYQNTRFVIFKHEIRPGQEVYMMTSLQDFATNFPEEWQAIQNDPVKKSKFIIFSGYSSWGAGQLEKEIRLGGWGITDFSDDMLSAQETPLDLWSRILKSVLEVRPPKDGRI